MTFGTQTTIAERWSRSAGANTVTDASDITKTYLNEGCREFAKRVHGLALEGFVSLSPNFEFATNAAINFSIKGGTASWVGDVPVASTALSNAGGSTVAQHLASNLNAYFATTSISVGWSASTWSFTLHGPATITNIAVAAATDIRYYNAVDEVFGQVCSKASTTLTGGFPQNCTMESSLPAGFLDMNYVMWDTWELGPAPFDLFLHPQATGTPSYYGVQNKRIRIYPSPTEQGRFEIYYKGAPTDLGVDGSSDSVSCPLPEEVHQAPIHWAAAKLFEESHEFDKAQYHYGMFASFCRDYIIREANNNPSLFPVVPNVIPPKVVT